MQSVFARSDDVVCRQVGAETILVPIRSNVGSLESVFVLSPVAARIWSLMDGATPVDGIVDRVCDEFEVERDTADHDVRELLDSLCEATLARPVTP